jgi:hypothetical protein
MLIAAGDATADVDAGESVGGTSSMALNTCAVVVFEFDAFDAAAVRMLTAAELSGLNDDSRMSCMRAPSSASLLRRKGK